MTSHNYNFRHYISTHIRRLDWDGNVVRRIGAIAREMPAPNKPTMVFLDIGLCEGGPNSTVLEAGSRESISIVFDDLEGLRQLSVAIKAELDRIDGRKEA